MTFAVDLISDLHIETWDSFDWTGQATSPYCIVAGDVCEDRNILIEVLTHLGKCYPGGVFYIDGNEEHSQYLSDLGNSYQDLAGALKSIKNVVYLQDNVVIIDGVAILATNGWWSYDFDPSIDLDQTVEWYRNKTNLDYDNALAINGVAYHDAAYMLSLIHI